MIKDLQAKFIQDKRFMDSLKDFKPENYEKYNRLVSKALSAIKEAQAKQDVPPKESIEGAGNAGSGQNNQQDQDSATSQSEEGQGGGEGWDQGHVESVIQPQKVRQK